MTFLNPLHATLGIACVAIPILIHILMRRRRKPVAWGAMKFLLAAYRQQRKRVRFEQFLLLAARCAVVALVALAIGKPVLGAFSGAAERGPRTLYILLDNSLTSQATPVAGIESELTILKQRAKSLLDDLNPSRGDRAALITLAGPAEGVILPPAQDVSRIAQLVDSVNARSSRADIAGALAMVRAAIERDQPDADRADATIAILTSWRAGAMDLSKPPAPIDGNARVRVRAAPPLAAPAPNVSIASVEPLRSVLVAGERNGPDAGSIPLKVVLNRSADAGARTTRLRAWRGERQPADPAGIVQAAIAWNQSQTQAFATITLPTAESGVTNADGDTLISVEADADALEGDNTFRRPLEVLPSLRIAMLAPSLGAMSDGSVPVDRFGATDWLALALSPSNDPLAPLRSGSVLLEAFDPDRLTLPASPDQPVPELRDARVILVPRPEALSARAWAGVASSCRRGALVMIVPPDAETTHLWPDAMNDALGLGWTLAREPVMHPTGWSIAPGTTLSPEEDLLALLRPELPDLVKPVRVARALRLDRSTQPFVTLLATDDGSPLILAARPAPTDGDDAPTLGMILLWLAPPALPWTNLPAKPLFVPLVQELVRQGAGAASARRTLAAGEGAPAPSGAIEIVRAGDSSVSLRISDDRTPPVRDAGVWLARAADGSDVASLAVNADPTAGDTAPQDRAQIDRWLNALSADASILGDADNDTATRASAAAGESLRDAPPISPILLVLAGLVALAEVLMARWFSHARVEGVPA